MENCLEKMFINRNECVLVVDDNRLDSCTLRVL